MFVECSSCHKSFHEMPAEQRRPLNEACKLPCCVDCAVMLLKQRCREEASTVSDLCCCGGNYISYGLVRDMNDKGLLEDEEFALFKSKRLESDELRSGINTTRCQGYIGQLLCHAKYQISTSGTFKCRITKCSKYGKTITLA